MHRSLNIALLSVALAAGGGGCSSVGDLLEPEVGSQAASASALVAEQCQAVTLIEVVHRVNGSSVTDRLRLTDEAALDPSLALRVLSDNWISPPTTITSPHSEA